MSPETLQVVLPVGGSLILVMIGIIGFFLRTVHNDVRKNTEAVGKNKGKIELVEKQQSNDIKRLEELTQLELKSLSKDVRELSSNVNSLVQIMIRNQQDG